MAAAVAQPLAPVRPWWEPAGLRSVTDDAAREVLDKLSELSVHNHLVCRLTVPAVLDPNSEETFEEEHLAQTILPFVKLDKLEVPGLKLGQVVNLCGNRYEYSRRSEAGTWSPTLLFACLTSRPAPEVEDEVLKHARAEVAKYYSDVFGDPEAWRCARRRQLRMRRPRASREPYPKNASGEPLALEVASGPHPCVPEAFDEELPLKPGFELDFEVNLEHVARSGSPEKLLELLELSKGNLGVTSSQGVTVLHLAALSGNVRLAAALAERAAAARGGPRAWRLADGRTPLHLAALFDSAELAQALLPACDPTVADGFGFTAAELARDLGHSLAAAALEGRPQTLQELCCSKICKQLRSAVDSEAVQSLLPMLRGQQLHDVVPLHDFRALSNLAAAAPEVVDASTLARSMSCMECWYADLFGRKASAALDGDMELIRVWDDLPSFAAPSEASEAATEPKAAVLAEAFGARGPPTVADRETFLERFHRRTGGVLKDIDWSNLLVIGGMVLACLTADDEEYAAHFPETDVDIYVVGAGFSSGKGFHERVCEVVECLPGFFGQSDYHVYLEGGKLKEAGGDVGLEYSVDNERGRLVVERVGGAVAEVCGDSRSRARRTPEPGDFVMSVNAEEEVDAMEKELADREMTGRYNWRKRSEELTYKDKDIVLRPAGAEDMPISANVVRTTSTLTACLQRKGGEPLPNLQVVLAPYASAAHLLFNTDIDCTAMGFDGTHLYATPRAREAIRHRRNVARPEKYAVRGEWRTDARLLKYAGRGFRVVDVGLRPGVKAPANEQAVAAAREAGRLLKTIKDARRDCVERCITRVRDSGVHGARLLLLAAEEPGLKQLMLHEAPMLRAGMDREELIDLVDGAGNRRNLRSLSEDEREKVLQKRLIRYNDGYGKAAAELLVVNPATRREEDQVPNRDLRGMEVPLTDAVVELDLEGDRFEVRDWYDGFPPEDLQPEHASLDPRAWRGIGGVGGSP